MLILGDAAKFLWGTQQLSVSRPPVLAGGFELFGTHLPAYNLFIMLLGPLIALARLADADPHDRRAAWCAPRRSTARCWARSAPMSAALYTGMFALASFLAGLSGALVTPIQSIVPGMDVEIIVQAFIVVVIGGLGSFWGTFLGSVIYGQVLSFGILIFPGFSLFSVFALMAVILILRPWGLLGRPLR